ncbi:MAG: TolC family protein, partial [Bacteroidota bacterium]
MIHGLKSSALLACCILICAFSTQAQQTLTLEYCLQRAVETNIQMRQNQTALSANQLALVQEKFDFAPQIRANASVNKAFGRTVDNFTQQIAESPWTGSPNLSATLVLFQGMSKWNNLRKAEFDIQATQYSMEDLANDIRINVALAFFQVMYAEDNRKVSENRLQILEQQLERTEKQAKAGTKTQGDIYSVQSEVATERVNFVNQENLYATNLLQLLLTLNLDPKAEYTLERPNLDLFDGMGDMESVDAVYTEAKHSNPGMRQRDMEILSRKYAMKSARAALMPTLSVSYGLGSFYSSNRPFEGYEPDLAAGELIPIFGETPPLFTQLETNFAQSLNFNLSIPIFQNYTLRQSYTVAKLNYENQQLVRENEEMELYKAVMTAHQDALVAKARFDATSEQLR